MKLSLISLAAVLACGPAAGARAANVGLIKIDGAIGPATANYIARAVNLAGARNDACLVIQLDTPGGLLDSTKQIVQTFYAATIPTVVYVAPSGASATQRRLFYHHGRRRGRDGARHQHRGGPPGSGPGRRREAR